MGQAQQGVGQPCRETCQPDIHTPSDSHHGRNDQAALPRGDSALRLEVNRALTQVYIGGEIDDIFNAWFGKLGRPSGLLAAMYLLNALPD